ncbi:MAG TPA: hypothetical protein VK545_08500 [Streptomyces sp.]|nr:hypothetical protein [Streptomyces sp.]
MELFRRTSERAAARARLSVAYVSLRATGDDGSRRRAGGRAVPLLRPDMSDWEQGGGESSGMRVEAALGGASRVLLRGEAGSGNTDPVPAQRAGHGGGNSRAGPEAPLCGRTAWLNSPDFVAPEVKNLVLDGCVLPDSPDAPDFPGVEVEVR